MKASHHSPTPFRCRAAARCVPSATARTDSAWAANSPSLQSAGIGIAPCTFQHGRRRSSSWPPAACGGSCRDHPSEPSRQASGRRSFLGATGNAICCSPSLSAG
jgi:hypothetical protein